MKTAKEFKSEVKAKWGNRLSISGYTKTHAPLKVHCNKCGHTWIQHHADQILERKNPCRYCFLANRTLSNETFLVKLRKINKKNNTHFEEVTACKGSHRPIKMKDMENGHIWLTSPHKILEGYSYLKEGINVRYTTPQFQGKLNNIYGFIKPGLPHMKVIGKYMGENHAVKIHCNKHNLTWNADAHNILGGHGCPENRSSHGETIMQAVLKKLGIKYNYSYRFYNPLINSHQDFDFYLPQYQPYRKGKSWRNGLAIEIDGVQHRKPVQHFGGYFNLYVTKSRDLAKNAYCIKHNIWLVRIPYYDRSNYARYTKRCIKILKEPKLLRHIL